LGVRRVGKSSLLKLKINELIKNGKNPFEILYLDFFSPKLIEYREANKVINLVKKYLNEVNIDFKKLFLFTDEIQLVKNWPEMLEFFRNKGVNLIVTGSNSNILNKEIGLLLTGRTVRKELFPLRFREFLIWEDKYNEEKILLFKYAKENLENYLISAIPEYVLLKDKEVLINTYYDILMRDIYYRYNIENKEEFEDLSFYLINNITNLITYNSLSKKLNINDKTIKTYLTYLNESYLFYFLNTYSTKAHEQINSPKKIYIVDNGFYYFIKTKTTRDIGKLMENLVFVNLRRKYKENEELFYYKTKNNYEIDFLIKEKNQIKELINVSYANSYDEINKREIRALLHAKEELNLSDKIPLTIITWDYEDEKEISWFGKKGRIMFIPLWKWLLNN
jgi:predicted AAA+ superfamily ATPase